MRPRWVQGPLGGLLAAVVTSHFGTMLGALSLTALVFLDASATQMGLLLAAGSLPAFLFTFPAGVWVDRLPHGRVMVLADFGRAALLLSVPAVALVGALPMEQLYIVAFGAGCLDVAFNLAYRSVLPAIVPAAGLVEANSKLQIGESVATSAAPSAGGLITQVLGAPVAVLIDAVTFLISGSLIARLAVPPRAEVRAPASVLAEALEGASTVASNRLLWALLGVVASYSFFAGFGQAVHSYWIVENLGFSPLTLGILLSAAGVGAAAGGLVAGGVTRRLGLGRAIVFSYATAATLTFLTPLAAYGGDFKVLLLLVELAGGDVLWIVHNVGAMSLRQSIPPAAQLGRVNACFLFAGSGMLPLGASLAGLAVSFIGVQAVLFLASAGVSAASLWLICSPLWRVRSIGPQVSA